MSYILDALKKIEHEKAKKSRAAGMTGISGELFREERQRPAGPGTWKIVALVFVTSLVTIGTTWFFLKPAGTPEQKRQASATPAARQMPLAPPVPPPVQPSVQQPVPAPLPPVAPQAARGPRPQAATPVVTDVSEPDSPNTLREPGRRLRGRRREAEPIAAHQPSVASTVPAPAEIKVAGIAWQEERSARRAVVNGFLMKEGSVVAGARISEILQDRVRFSGSGGNFEVSMVTSGMPGANK